MKQKVYISGMHSGQNPSAGIGIARCLRKAFPDLTLVGADHWQGSSGLHDAAVDEVLLFPQWKQIDRQRHITQIREILNAGHIWISALDVEVFWLAQNFGTHPNLLCPSGAALKRSAKPHVEDFSKLGFEVPDYISAFLPDAETHSFLRQNAWQCWLKGPYHDAKRINCWEVFEKARENMSEEWKTNQLFLQRNMIGNEESICFAAYHGELVSAVHMEKRLITPEGKTWSGRVTAVDEELASGLKEVLKDLNWSGGGEIEYTCDPDGTKWIIECNPRFPAWIYGSALVGLNLPGRMIAKALNLPLLESQSKFPFFTRVVQEIAAKESIGIPRPPDPTLNPWPVGGGKGKGASMQASVLPPLSDTMELKDFNFIENEDAEMPEVQVPANVPEAYSSEVEAIANSFEGETPTRILLENWTMSRFNKLLDAVKASRGRQPEIRIGYSVKTSPTDQHLSNARKSGFLIECISQAEVHKALSIGTPPKDIILNGPGKFWPLTRPPVTGIHMLFCDSIEEFDRVMKIPNIAAAIGMRIQLPKLPSRFGIPVNEYEDFEKVLNCVNQLKGKAKLGFHFHMPSWIIGVKRWKEAAMSILTWCISVEQLTGVPVQRLDFGGGFFPSDLEGLNFSWLQEKIKEALPNVEGIYFEPGRSLTQEGEVVVSRVLSARTDKENKLEEVVVDACVAELPLIQSYSHRVFYKKVGSDEPFRILEKGKTKVLGRICMESDVLCAGINLPDDAKIGDLVIFADAGAYERTMSYDFGRG